MMSIFQKDGFLEANILLEPYQPFEVSRSWKGIINIFTKEEIRKEIFSFYRVNIFHRFCADKKKTWADTLDENLSVFK
jgi:hypothetical protein